MLSSRFWRHFTSPCPQFVQLLLVLEDAIVDGNHQFIGDLAVFNVGKQLDLEVLKVGDFPFVGHDVLHRCEFVFFKEAKALLFSLDELLLAVKHCESGVLGVRLDLGDEVLATQDALQEIDAASWGGTKAFGARCCGVQTLEGSR